MSLKLYKTKIVQERLHMNDMYDGLKNANYEATSPMDKVVHTRAL